MPGRRANQPGGEDTRHGASQLVPLAAELRVGKRLAGYQIEGIAGRGGMGVVYRARHVHLERPAALKVLVPELVESRDFRDRFLRESRTAASINHPHIITVYDAGEADGLLYIAMQYVDGPDLGELLQRDGALEPRRALSLLGQVAGALDAAHANGVVHRDVKPGNVLVDSEHCYLTDFGLTKRLSSQTALTARGQFVGTVDYMAPEQIENGALDARTDVYALGCMVYHSLTGRVPFERDSEVSVVYAHLKEPPPALVAVRPDLPTGLGPVLATALAKSKEDRPSSCGELVAALETELDGGDAGVEPGAEGPPPVKLLVAAEEPRMRALVRASVKGCRLRVLEAADRESVIAMARREQPRIALLDWEMSGGSAAEICSALRDHPETAGIKIVTMTTRAQAGRAATPAGADDSILKPFSPLQLLYKLRDLLGVDLVES